MILDITDLDKISAAINAASDEMDRKGQPDVATYMRTVLVPMTHWMGNMIAKRGTVDAADMLGRVIGQTIGSLITPMASPGHESRAFAAVTIAAWMSAAKSVTGNVDFDDLRNALNAIDKAGSGHDAPVSRRDFH